MADPIGGGVGKAPQQMMQEMMRQQLEQVQTPGAQGGQFAQKVDKAQAAGNVQAPTEVQKVDTTLNATKVLKTHATRDGQSVTTNPVKGKDPLEKIGMRRMLEQVMSGQNKLDKIINVATSGRVFSPQELLAVQAGVYKFSQELELTSKVVEKATSGVKQTMQTQV